ncbi:hypothetical protein CR513_06865, partial [Mucuna pruriens]
MEEIRAWAKKHIEVEEDLAYRLKAECKGNYKPGNEATQFTSLKMKRAKILRKVYRTSLLDIALPTEWQMRPSRDKWCEFHQIHGHTTEGCWTLRSQIEKLICEGYLSRFIQTQRDATARGHNLPRPKLLRRVLVDQGSFANVLYWSTFRKMKLPKSRLEEFSSTLIGFLDKQVEIHDCIKIKTTFGTRRDAKTIPVKYMIINVGMSYNVILG